jgi:hypothetical protein
MDNPDTAITGAGDERFRVIVATRDSAAWIGALADAYDCAGIRPLFVVDSRSGDGTVAVLQNLGADVVEVLPASNHIQDIVWRIPSLTDACWVLRINDDEMPSRRLLQWVRSNLDGFTLTKVAFPRRWAFQPPGGRLSYSEHKQLYSVRERPGLLDPQIRLFRPHAVNYTSDLRTPGFTTEGGTHTAPLEAFICHFDWIVRTFAERHAKLLRYETELPGSGSALRHFYLPELIHPADRCEEPFETTEFDTLAAVFALYRTRPDAARAEPVPLSLQGRAGDRTVRRSP